MKPKTIKRDGVGRSLKVGTPLLLLRAGTTEETLQQRQKQGATILVLPSTVPGCEEGAGPLGHSLPHCKPKAPEQAFAEMGNDPSGSLGLIGPGQWLPPLCKSSETDVGTGLQAT